MAYHELYPQIKQRINARLAKCEPKVDPQFINYVVHLLARDYRHGILKFNNNKISGCMVDTFVDYIVAIYLDSKHLTMINMRMAWIMKMGKEIDCEYVKEKYERTFQEQLELLINDILQYPETANKLQLDQLFVKMQVFIVVCYGLGCPKNHVLLKLAAQALNSVIGRSDLQNYVLKRKYHRLEYLKRLSATVAGILIYNNDGPDGDRENMRFVITDLEMAQQNTMEAFEAGIQRLQKGRATLQKTILQLLEVDIDRTVIRYKVPLDKLRWLNEYIITFSLLERKLRLIQQTYEKTAYLIELKRNHYDCVIAKINDTLKMRTAIESELIFPHFVYLGQLWMTLNNYLNHVVELNKLREKLEVLLPSEIEERAYAVAKELTEMAKRHPEPIECTFFERMKSAVINKTNDDFCKLSQCDVKEFCSLSFAVTNGLLLPANFERNLCKNIDLKFGFAEPKYSHFAEHNFKKFLNAYRSIVLTNVNLALLFNFGDALIEQELLPKAKELPKQSDFNGQTEMIITNDLSAPNWINVTWNQWDYHRETIHLAEIRKRQTCDTQTTISYGKRNAQNQTYNTRYHF